ncbi:MAG: CFI-box-CTERM domain-containing protein [Nannocystaceae bacterium]
MKREADEPAGDVVIEFLFRPVPRLQIAVWLEHEDGQFLRDVFVTQATAKLGIGNRPGVWNFLSSWRAPYGPRQSVLPIWGHRRNTTYPRIVWHDDDPQFHDSLGFHESTSSGETYYCRPLTPSEQTSLLQSDTLSCPSPDVFRTDKGRYSTDGSLSVYPPRSDLIALHPQDHNDVAGFGQLSGLDAITGATPHGGTPIKKLARLGPVDTAKPLVAWIEVSLENDQHDPDWVYERDDHFVDPRLKEYGVSWLGQPSVVYKLTFNPARSGLYTVRDYAGYGSWDGSSGDLFPPDFTIANDGGSGSDRLGMFKRAGENLKFGVNVRAPDDGSVWCDEIIELEALTDLRVEARAHDRAKISFQVPASLASGAEVSQLVVHYMASIDKTDAAMMESAPQQDFVVCTQDNSNCTVHAEPGRRASVEIDELWGDYTYQFAVGYEDTCANRSLFAQAEVTTPRREFQQIDTFCVVSTAAYGGDWRDEVVMLRDFRDQVLNRFAVGRAWVRSYYAYGPALAQAIAPSPHLRSGARALLDPLCAALKPATSPPQNHPSSRP